MVYFVLSPRRSIFVSWLNNNKNDICIESLQKIISSVNTGIFFMQVLKPYSSFSFSKYRKLFRHPKREKQKTWELADPWNSSNCGKSVKTSPLGGPSNDGREESRGSWGLYFTFGMNWGLRVVVRKLNNSILMTHHTSTSWELWDFNVVCG